MKEIGQNPQPKSSKPGFKTNDILINLLTLDGNETNYIKDSEIYLLYKDLMIEVVKIEKNIRYCNRKDCPCQPEYKIRKLLEDKQLVDFLNDYRDGLVDKINVLCDSYEPVTKRIPF